MKIVGRAARTQPNLRARRRPSDHRGLNCRWPVVHGHHEAIVEARGDRKLRGIRREKERRRGRRGGEALGAGGAALATALFVFGAGGVFVPRGVSSCMGLAVIGMQAGRVRHTGTFVRGMRCRRGFVRLCGGEGGRQRRDEQRYRHPQRNYPAQKNVLLSHAPTVADLFRWYQPLRRRNASRYFSTVLATTSGGSSGPGDFLFQPLASSQSRTYCLSKLGGLAPGL